MTTSRANIAFLVAAVLCIASLPFFAEKFYVQFFAKILIMAILAMSLDLLIGVVDTFGKVILPQAAGVLVYLMMALILLCKPKGLFAAG